MVQSCDVKSGNCRFFSMSVLYHCDPVLLKSVNYQLSVRKKNVALYLSIYVVAGSLQDMFRTCRKEKEER